MVIEFDQILRLFIVFVIDPAAVSRIDDNGKKGFVVKGFVHLFHFRIQPPGKRGMILADKTDGFSRKRFPDPVSQSQLRAERVKIRPLMTEDHDAVVRFDFFQCFFEFSFKLPFQFHFFYLT